MLDHNVTSINHLKNKGIDFKCEWFNSDIVLEGGILKVWIWESFQNSLLIFSHFWSGPEQVWVSQSTISFGWEEECSMGWSRKQNELTRKLFNVVLYFFPYVLWSCVRSFCWLPIICILSRIKDTMFKLCTLLLKGRSF